MKKVIMFLAASKHADTPVVLLRGFAKLQKFQKSKKNWKSRSHLDKKNWKIVKK